MRTRQHVDTSKAMQRLMAVAKAADTDVDLERVENAEAVIAAYGRAVATRILDQLPSREELGLVCFWLTLLCTKPREKDLQFAVDLLTPALGMWMFDCLATVQALRDHALQAIEEAASKYRPPIADEDLSF